MQPGDGAEQEGGAVGHGHVHHLALAGALRLQQRAHHAKGQQHAAPPKSPTRLSGGTGFSPGRPMACSSPVSAM